MWLCLRYGPREAKAASSWPTRLCVSARRKIISITAMRMIVTKIYHGDAVELTDAAKKQAKRLTELGFGNMPICMAKTQYSFSDDQKLLGAPRGFKVTVRNLKVSAGAGFIVALTGDIMTMPGLPKVPAAEKIDVDETGKISGLF